MKSMVMTVTVAVAVASSTALAQDEVGRETLRGLKGVCVAVEAMNPDAERDGLTRAQLQTDTELRLRKAGIKVLSEDERLRTPGAPALYVRVGTFKHPAGIYAFSINVSVHQWVALTRSPTTLVLATTWSAGDYVGVVVPAGMRKLRGIVGDRVDKFMNAYLSVNPKKPKAD